MIRILLSIVFLCSYICLSQETKNDTITKKKYYAWAITMDGKKHWKYDHLKDLHDSTIVFKIDRKLPDLTTFDIQDIDMLKFRQKGAGLKGMGIGFLAGFGLGFLAGYSSGPSSGSIVFSSQSKAQVGMGGGLLGGMFGSILGGAAGSAKIKYRIGGDYDNFNSQRKEIKRHILFL